MRISNYYINLISCRNSNSNKISLLTKLRNENARLKEEVNNFRKNFEYLDKTLNIKSKSKLNLMEYATTMSNKDSELNESKKVIHNSLQRSKQLFDTYCDDFTYTLTENMKNHISGKSLEENFNFYFEKIVKYVEVSFILYFC